MLRMSPRHMLQQAVGIDSMNQWHAESVKQDSFLRGIMQMDYQGKKAPEQAYFMRSKVVRTGSQNNTINAGEVLNLFTLFGLERNI